MKIMNIMKITKIINNKNTVKFKKKNMNIIYYMNIKREKNMKSHYIEACFDWKRMELALFLSIMLFFTGYPCSAPGYP